jgi:hypothetical protein
METVVAIFILTIGLIGTAAALSYALQFTSISRNVGNAKLVATSTIEEIESARNTRRLVFDQIANVPDVDNTGAPNVFGGFSEGYNPVAIRPGPDGVNGTDDDLLDPGANGTYGDADDFENPAFARGGYEREIIIEVLSVGLKRVQVNVRYYSSGGSVAILSAVSYINDEDRTTGS